MRRDPNCVFCQIASGDAPSHKVYEDDAVVAFMDIAPVGEGHTLIVMKEHFENLFEASEAALISVVRVSRRIANAIRATLAPDGLLVVQTNGAAAGQTVFHYHMHLIPRGPDGHFDLHGRRRADPQKLAKLADTLARAIREAS
jgi:histidine triad (HIT) family protein